MDTNEMRSLEIKTREIVETLSGLERETERQRRMGDQLEEGKNAILGLASELSKTADRLAEAIDLLQRSTLAKDIESLDSKIDDARGLADLARDDVRRAEEICRSTAELATTAKSSIDAIGDRLTRVEGACAELLKGMESVERESQKREAYIASRLDNLESVIGRIDRNTQKGFGKERG